MTPKEIIGRCGELSVCEKRTIGDDYCELVFYTKDTDAWIKVLADNLGPTVKPGREDSRLAEDFGGIRGNQTLFKKEFDDFFVIAMLWPWQDNASTTLKIALVKKQK